MKNFEEFIRLYRDEEKTLFYSYLTSPYSWYIQSKSFDDYYICCFSKNNYGKEMAYDEQISKSCYIDCTKEWILKRFKDDIGQLKRPLGLYLEYALVREFDLTPNTAKKSTGKKAWDFILGKEKVDFKSCFFKPYNTPNNVSIYNRAYVLTIEDIQIILGYITVKKLENEKSFKKLLEKIKKTLVTGNN